MNSRKAKLEKALAFDDTLQDISAHPEAFRQGRAAEMARLAQLHAALLEAVEALELSECLCHHKWTEQGDIFTKCFNCKALAKLDQILKGDQNEK